MGSVLVVPRADPAAPERDLVLFPAGGNGPSAFEPWQPLLPSGWRVTTVCLPGRGSRLAEPLPTGGLPALADEIAGALTRDRALLSGQAVYFGHSMGALLALEVATRLPPALLVTAACAPVVAADAYGDPDQEKVRDVVRRRARAQGIDDSGFIEELADVVAPILRADLLMLDGYQLPTTVVACDIVSYYGTEDPVPAMSWTSRTTGSAQRVLTPGGHYFFQSNARFLIADLVSRGTQVP